mmetsp:Transcript_9480/g.19824  ORF Transcript_9480/g.19824 Transcript_9480/m.19824 type:complete len:257 (+) Transcript_9480:106-876(+)
MYQNHTKLTFYDVGGEKKIRSIWQNYYHDVNAVIFVLDTTCSHETYETSLDIATAELNHGYIRQKPLLILCNKIDKSSYLVRSVEQIRKDFSVGIPNGSPVQFCEIDLHDTNADVRDLIEDCLKKLISAVLNDWDRLRERGEKETEEYNEKQLYVENEKKRRVFRQCLTEAFGLKGEEKSGVFERESGEEFLAEELGVEGQLPLVGKDVAKLVNYHKVALMMIGGMIAPSRKKKHCWTWDEVRNFVQEMRCDVGIQ